TNRTGFIPTLFLMIVVTALELSLVLRAADVDYIILMLTPVLAANSYQVLALHEVTKRDEEHIKRIEERRKARRKKMEMNKKKTAEKSQGDFWRKASRFNRLAFLLPRHRIAIRR